MVYGKMRVIARVCEMMECMFEHDERVQRVVRLWCDRCVEPFKGGSGRMQMLCGECVEVVR